MKKRKGNKKNDENLLFATKTNKNSKDTTTSQVPDGASSCLLKEDLINDVYLSQNVAHPVAKSGNVKKARPKIVAGKCLKSSKIKVILDEKVKNSDDSTITGYKSHTYLLQGLRGGG